MGKLEFKSSTNALILNGKLTSILRPWHIIIDTDKRQIIMKRRNWYYFSYNETIYAFNSIKNIKVKKHLFGADISVKVYAGEAFAYYLKKKDADKIRDLLIS